MFMGLMLILVSNTANSDISQSDFESDLMISDLRWSDIFGPSKSGSDLYKLVYSNLFVNPEKNALKESAQKFGLTTAEMEKVVGGSVSALANNPSRNYNDNSYAQLVDEYSAIQEYYNDTLEIQTLQEDMNAISLPNEIFSNGSLSDSGFDLIDDYRRMQKILFNKESTTETGGSFNGSPSSPNIDIYQSQEINKFAENNSTGNGAGIEAGDGGAVANSNDVNSNATNTGDANSGDLNSNQADSTEKPIDEIKISEEDLCTEDTDSLNDVLKNFEEEKLNSESQNNNTNNGNQGGGENGNGNANDTDSNNGNVSRDEVPYELFSDDGGVNPAQRSKWGGSFCPNIIPSSSASGDGYQAIAGQNGFESLASVEDSLLNNTLAAGAATVLGGENLSLKIAVCFSTELIYKTYSTYLPSESCIKCEVDRINEILSDVLSHSLIPNKVAGNYMESAKCKDAFSLVPSLNIIAIAAPIATPMNYDLISEKNIFEEWNDFVTEFQPFLSDAGKIPGDYESSFILENSSETQTFDRAMLEIKKIQNDNLAKALDETTNKTIAKDLKDQNLYAREFFVQIQQFNNEFKSIQNLIKKIDENACKLIKDKPSI